MNQLLLSTIVGYCSSLFASISYMLILKYLKKKKTIYTHIINTIICGSVIAGIIYAITPRIPTADRVFSDFNSGFPLTANNVQWGVFNDCPYNGNSNITPFILTSAGNSGDCYLVLDYYLGEKSITRPYCGVFAGFAPKPADPRDASEYNGIKIEIWHEDNTPIPKGVHIYIQISPYRMISEYDGYHQYELTENAKSLNSLIVTIPFADFTQPPERAGQKVPLTKDLQKAIYQIAIVIQGEKSQISTGRVLIDNIEFYK